MLIAASDYDGTLANRQGLMGDVAGAVRRWRAAGNVFGIATGRDLAMMLPETEKRGIEYDFLVCANGAAVYDADLSLLASKLLQDDLPGRLMRHPAGMASMHYQLSGLGGLRLLAREGSWFPGLGVPYTDVSFEEAQEIRELAQLSLAYRTVEECERRCGELERDFGGLIAPHPNRTTIDINAPGVDKASGIEEVVRRRGWEGCGVLAIGDGGNDVGMIRRFGGFTVPDADGGAMRAATRVFADVPSMLAAMA